MHSIRRGIAWVQAQLAKLHANEQHVHETYQAKWDALAAAQAVEDDARRPKPKRERVTKPATARPRLKLAVLWGVNAYLNEYGQPSSANELRGCVNDIDHVPRNENEVAGWRQILEARGWTIVACLLDAQATEANIVSALARMFDMLEPGDTAAVFNASHGTLMDDATFPDGQEEALVPHDGLVEYPSRLLSLSKLEDLVREHASLGSIILWFTDSCHSGIRDLFRWMPRVLMHPATPAETNVTRSFSTPPAHVVGTAWHGVVLWSGCAKAETSADAVIGGIGAGAASACAKKSLSRLGSVRLRDLHEAQLKLLDAGRYGQHPQLCGDPVLFDLAVL